MESPSSFDETAAQAENEKASLLSCSCAALGGI
jgi:hypothetical protein